MEPRGIATDDLTPIALGNLGKGALDHRLRVGVPSFALRPTSIAELSISATANAATGES